MNNTIQLRRRWRLGVQIGQGGFGRVFEATGDDGSIAAVKLIPRAPGADRELLFVDLREVRNVVPILDSGEHGTDWALVMPRATMSLRAHLTARKTLPAAEAVAILADVAAALSDLEGRVVHRDIKPENILLLDNHWCLSDLGIARYVESSTAADTHKWAWTDAYNAPERWRSERATSASDIYSLGILAFELLSGHPPFLGPDFRNQHLTQLPTDLSTCPLVLADIVSECLSKAPGARPSAARLTARLAGIDFRASNAASLLQAANRQQVGRLTADAVIQSSAREAADRRHELAASCVRSLSVIARRMFESIRDNASAVTLKTGTGGDFLDSVARLGEGTLEFSAVRASVGDAWGQWRPSFDVVAHATLSVTCPINRFGYEGRSHSLWYCDAQQQGVFGWFETAFMFNPLLPKSSSKNPFSLPPDERSGKAVSRAMTEFQVAWPFTLVESGSEGEFLDRWITWFATATRGELSHPRSMPERDPQGSWRY